ncbi:HAD family hydrolase [Paenibacillus typhae]|uniref:Putative hydrolase of the HAD superfamily n=1 Tax=Paenibacillus typhae TaxID=1174501 RepID=A0A1G9HBB7_9BACL|nr:HAD family hydrolase [Paenibacillus typhae]SDL10301.1 putative hydrolase of the HAD superfamily [Paenibacillus typhae]
MDNSSKLAVFFDLDDTLYDHLVPFREAVCEVLAPDEGSLDYAELFYTVRHHSDLLWPKYLSGELELEETRVLRLELAFAEYGIALSREQAERVQAAYIGRQYTIEMIDGVEEQIRRFLALGHKVGVITNGPKEHQTNKLRGLGIDKLIPAEMIFISDAVGLAKPDPAIFRHVNEATGTTPDNSLYVGDTWDNDVVGALSAGWKVCWYNPRGRQPRTEHVPSYVFADYEEFSRLPLI